MYYNNFDTDIISNSYSIYTSIERIFTKFDNILDVIIDKSQDKKIRDGLYYDINMSDDDLYIDMWFDLEYYGDKYECCLDIEISDSCLAIRKIHINTDPYHPRRDSDYAFDMINECIKNVL